MSVDRNELERIANLARLRLEEAEAERMTRELNGILDHVAALEGVSDGAADEVARPADGIRATRDSEEGEPDPLGSGPEAIAPRWAEGFFVVPPPPGVHAEEGES